MGRLDVQAQSGRTGTKLHAPLALRVDDGRDEDMKKEKRFSLAARIVGGLSAVLFIGVLVVFATSGLSIASGILLAAALTGLVVPCVSAGESLLDAMGAMLELVVEGITTLIEAVLSGIASIFG